MVETDGAFRTGDMTLATLLTIQGYESKMELVGIKAILWVFEELPDDGQQEIFDDLIDAYQEYACKVEPRNFVLALVQVRRDMFAFMNSGGRPGAPSAQRG